MTIEEFKQDCLRERNERRSREEADRTRRGENLERLRTTVLATIIQQVREAIPEPLREFVAYDGVEPSEDQLKGFPDRWMPCNFRVEAPGLLPMFFITTTVERVSQVTSIRVGAQKFKNDWIEAVAAAVIVAEEETEVKR